MKTFYSLFMFLAASFLLNAQGIPVHEGNAISLKPAKADFQLNNDFNSGVVQNIDNKMHINHTLGTIDTLDDNYKRSTAFPPYTYTSQQGNPLPITGYNTYFFFIGQKFPYQGQARVTGVLAAYRLKAVQQDPDQLNILIFRGRTTDGNPDSLIGSQTFDLNEIDTNSSQVVFSYFGIDSPVSIENSFVVFFQTRATGGAGDDVTWMYSNAQGDGNGENRFLYLVPNQQGGLSFGDPSTMFTGSDGQPIDIDLMILPVIETGTSVEDGISFPGLKVENPYPNPANDNATINLTLDSPSDVTIGIAGTDGRQVRKFEFPGRDAGMNKLGLDLRGIPSGNYFYTVNAAGYQFAGKFVIAR